LEQIKSFNIPKRLIYEAYKRVKANKGSAGVDGQSLKDFDQDLENNLYKLWNRMSSGSYFPQPVKRVEIPKAAGGMRPLGIPTVTDRIAQMAVKMQIEPELEQCFHPDSYGYRPDKSAHQALDKVRSRCHQRAWVLDMDIKGFFDAINHDLLRRAVEKHVKEPAVYKKMVGGTGEVFRRSCRTANSGYATRWSYQPSIGESVFALQF
jgi:group II intron reverse transcriptase/maturase